MYLMKALDLTIEMSLRLEEMEAETLVVMHWAMVLGMRLRLHLEPTLREYIRSYLRACRRVSGEH